MRSFVKSWTFVGGLFLHMSTPLYISLWQESQSSPMLRDSFTSHLCSIPTTKSSWIKFPWSRCYWSAFSYVVTIVILFARHQMLFTFDFHQNFSIIWPPPTTKSSRIRFLLGQVLLISPISKIVSSGQYCHLVHPPPNVFHQMFSTKGSPPRILHLCFPPKALQLWSPSTVLWPLPNPFRCSWGIDPRNQGSEGNLTSSRSFSMP